MAVIDCLRPGLLFIGSYSCDFAFPLVFSSRFWRRTAPAATPSLGAIRPVGGQRGTEMEITLSGARLGDAQEIVYYQPGITTVSLKKIDDNNVRAKIKIAADCALGLHDIRLRTATGISELRTFSVGALKEFSEVEPNNDFQAPRRSR